MMPETLPNLHSARSPDANNPFTLFKCCCRHVRIQEIVRPVAILSFIVFIANSVMLGISLEWAALLFVVIGALIYGLLFQAIFRTSHRNWVLGYITFEMFSMGMLLVIVSTNVIDVTSDRVRKGNKFSIINISVLFGIYILLKVYFTAVFIHFYRYLSFAAHRLNQVHAQYVNGGVHISADQIFPPPPPFAAASNLPADHPTRDPAYGYAIPYAEPTLTQLPSYSDTMATTRKERPTAVV